MMGAPSPAFLFEKYERIKETVEVVEVIPRRTPNDNNFIKNNPTLAGYIYWELINEGAKAIIRNVVVDPAFQRRGLGYTLITRLRSRLPRHTEALGLFAETSNTAALKLYEKCGLTSRHGMHVLRVPRDSISVQSRGVSQHVLTGTVSEDNAELRQNIARVFCIQNELVLNSNTKVYIARTRGHQEMLQWKGCAVIEDTGTVIRPFCAADICCAWKLLEHVCVQHFDTYSSSEDVLLAIEKGEEVIAGLVDGGAQIALKTVYMEARRSECFGSTGTLAYRMPQ